MADLKPFAGMSQEETQQALLYVLAAMLERMPRIDGNDRLVVNTSDQGSVTVALASNQTLATVTTVAALTSMQNMGSNNAPANLVPLQIANAGVNYIYDRIVFA